MHTLSLTLSHTHTHSAQSPGSGWLNQYSFICPLFPGGSTNVQLAFSAPCLGSSWDRLRPRDHVSGSVLSPPMNRTQKRRLLFYFPPGTFRGQSPWAPPTPTPTVIPGFLCADIMQRPAADRWMWEGAPPPPLITLSCSLCCLGHREQGSWSGKPALMSEQEEAEGDEER